MHDYVIKWLGHLQHWLGALQAPPLSRKSGADLELFGTHYLALTLRSQICGQQPSCMILRSEIGCCSPQLGATQKEIRKAKQTKQNKIIILSGSSPQTSLKRHQAAV